MKLAVGWSAAKKAQAMAKLIVSGTESVAQVCEDILPTSLEGFSARGRRALESNCTPAVVQRALQHRARALQEFNRFYPPDSPEFTFQ